ncbi:MAG: prepilin-type N-terminal cleavage/methylation domain-containing protein [Lachnospiraceae bacterium]|nr:prepilin-type N-terminal cleavage/methylation domain-containing protein [Lachnospiraceae bacterium]
MKKMNQEGFSLVELVIAMAISAIVMSSVILIIGYASRSMSLTQAKVSLQDQAKDALNHISAYAMEASGGLWTDSTKVLELHNQKIGDDGNIKSVDMYFYWQTDNALYFGDMTSAVSESALSTADKRYLLAENVDGFKCEIKKDDKTGKKILHVEITMRDEMSEFICSKDIYMRNQ